MKIETLVYLGMLLAQLYSLNRIIAEAKACNWSPQSRWIAHRAGGITLGVMAVTALCGWMLPETNLLSKMMVIMALAAMTVLLIINLPSIEKGMTDERVAEDLNFRNETADENEQ